MFLLVEMYFNSIKVQLEPGAAGGSVVGGVISIP